MKGQQHRDIIYKMFYVAMYIKFIKEFMEISLCWCTNSKLVISSNKYCVRGIAGIIFTS